MNRSGKDISALILCGGRSTRMGSDKGLKEDQRIPRAQQLYKRLADLNIPAYLSVRSEQIQPYRQRMPGIPLISDDALQDINGPLRGIISAHRKMLHDSLLVVPCDMPLLDEKVFAYWVKEFEQSDATVISRTGTYPQPLCGIYHRTDLAQLDELYQCRELTDRSMNWVTNHILSTHFMDIPEAMIPQFKNINTPQDEL